MTLAELMNRGAELRMQAISSGMIRLNRLTIVVDPRVHDSDRHFAACAEDVTEIRIAPELADLPSSIVDGILMHELGHAADFAYPGRWSWLGPSWGEHSAWLAAAHNVTRDDVRMWKRRTPYEVEIAADRIAESLFGVRIGYVGELMLQSTAGGIRPRPLGI